MCVRAILLLVDPINYSVRSANKGGAQAPRAPPLAKPLLTPIKSSANNIPPNVLPLLNCISSSTHFTSFNKQFINTENNMGNKLQPWAAPCPTLNESISPPLKVPHF